VEKALGFSVRTLQRRKQAGTKPLNLEQSSRVWEFAEILARAISVFGSRDEAQEWMVRPDIALEQRRPLDMMATSEGRRMVEELLDRMEFGVDT
jgi:putative toxin-antitoxin system antitoxin component (TIGR02293 family)